MERATIAGSTFMLMVTSSSLIQDATGLDGNLAFTLIGGFVIVRAFKTIANTLLSSRFPKPVKIIGNLFIGATLLGGSAGALLSSAHQTPEEFSTFHGPVIAIFALELVVWETVSCVTQMIYCTIVIKKQLGNVAKIFANPIILYYLDGHGLGI